MLIVHEEYLADKADEYLAKDPNAAAATAQRRILEVHGLADGQKKVADGVNMFPKRMAETAALDKLAGFYHGKAAPIMSSSYSNAAICSG